MNKNCKRSILALSLAMILAGCGDTTSDNRENIDDSKITARDMYTNKFGEDRIPSQWIDYGVGDPFVMRFNGKYYMYCSTKNYETGVRGYVSDDLMYWKCMTGIGLEDGYVSNDPCTLTAYAPEVIYLDGYFYMCQSQGGNGHYILKSERPEGPFKAITSNFGESIDGSFFQDDDDQLYFLRASNNGIRIIKVNDDLSMGASKTLDNSQLGGWTEGPYMLKRDGIYYLTYTGNSVTSEGYRVGYSYSRDQIFDRSAFSLGDTILLNTEDDFKGLGHSSTVLGPNLDSYYICYHNLNSSGGPNRSFDISRLSFAGTEMLVDNGKLENNFVPESPIFKSEDETSLIKEGDFLLAEKDLEDIYTAEFNYSGENTKAVLSYADSDNYDYVIADSSSISHLKVKEGKEEKITKTSFNRTYDMSKLHTIRVSSGEDVTKIYFDNMLKIEENTTLNNGKIGYRKSADSKIYSTTLSCQANGSSERKELSQEKILLKNSASYKFSSSSISEVIDDETLDFNMKEGSYDLLLEGKNDYAQYNIYTDKDSYYGFDFTYHHASSEKTFDIQIDDENRNRITLPNSDDTSSQYIKSTLFETELKKGVHKIKIYATNDKVRLHKLELFRSSRVWPTFSNSLKEYVMKGARYVTTWKLKDDGHYSLSGSRNLMYFGDDTFTDFTFEADIKLVGETQASSVGLILRGFNPAFGSVDDVSSIQGYYVGFNNNKAFISRCDYNNSEMDVVADAVKFSSEKLYHIKAEAYGNRIDLQIGDTSLTYYDANCFSHGSIGLYTDGASCVYKDVKISHR